MYFGDAIKELHAGRRVYREGWNDKGMYLRLMEGFNGEEYLTDMGEACTGPVDPCIWMMTTKGTWQPGWLASQADMLADDWRAIPSELPTDKAPVFVVSQLLVEGVNAPTDVRKVGLTDLNAYLLGLSFYMGLSGSDATTLSSLSAGDVYFVEAAKAYVLRIY
jgi:hypothetical protein